MELISLGCAVLDGSPANTLPVWISAGTTLEDFVQSRHVWDGRPCRFCCLAAVDGPYCVVVTLLRFAISHSNCAYADLGDLC